MSSPSFVVWLCQTRCTSRLSPPHHVTKFVVLGQDVEADSLVVELFRGGQIGTQEHQSIGR
jgi:hypothetical protein